MKFERYIPCKALQPYIRSLAIIEAPAESCYKLLPGTGIVIGLQYKGRMWQAGNGTKQPLSTARITGLHDSYRSVKKDAEIGTVMVYFKEGGTVPFFRQQAQELFDDSIPLVNMVLRSELLVLEEQLFEAITDAEKIQAAEQFLLGRMMRTAPDLLVTQALRMIHDANGDIRITELAAQLHTTTTQLEKRFLAMIGTTARRFADLVRMKYLISTYDARATHMHSYPAPYTPGIHQPFVM